MRRSSVILSRSPTFLKNVFSTARLRILLARFCAIPLAQGLLSNGTVGIFVAIASEASGLDIAWPLPQARLRRCGATRQLQIPQRQHPMPI